MPPEASLPAPATAPKPSGMRPTSPPISAGATPVERRLLRGTGLAALALTAGFGVPLADLMRFGVGDELYSHLPLIPLISGYFAWLAWSENRPRLRFDPVAALVPALLGAGLIAWPWLVAGGASATAPVNTHARLGLAYVLLLVAVVTGGLGRAMLRANAFPALLLVFMVPMPVALHDAVEQFLQHGSAEAAALYFSLSGTPFFRQGLVFELPGMTLRVAPECSGIHSSLALFITSLVAGKLFLRSLGARALLALAVLPLALLRNGFRILVIGLLCVHISPEMIHSWVHRQGGPFFFALSLIPFGLLLFLLWRRERRPVSPAERPA